MDDDYVLRWPRDVFKAEVAELLNQRRELGDWSERCQVLLDDAFVTAVPSDAFRRLDDGPMTPSWGRPASAAQGSTPLSPSVKWLAELLRRADTLPYEGLRRPYYTERQAGSRQDQVGLDTAVHEFERLVGSFDQRGYLERAFGKDCVDDPSDVNPKDVIESLLPRRDLWPIDRQALVRSPGRFLDLIEVLHDLVEAPRMRSMHGYANCGWHYRDFSAALGRSVYRWSVNRILDRTTLGLRLADEGEDRGRLVAVTDDARSHLVDRMVQRDDQSTGEVVRHAIALFRARGATEHEKRSASIALAGVLEERRALLQEELPRADEGALFTIANRFAIRHQNAQQQADYDPVFLDWVFWFYLATIELSDRLIERRGAQADPTPKTSADPQGV